MMQVRNKRSNARAAGRLARDPAGWIIRGAALITTYALAMSLSRPGEIASAPATQIASGVADAAADAAAHSGVGGTNAGNEGAIGPRGAADRATDAGLADAGLKHVQGGESIPEAHRDAWLAARRKLQASQAEYTALVAQIQAFFGQHVALLRETRQCGSILLAERSKAGGVAAPTPRTAETEIPRKTSAEQERLAILHSHLSRLEAERAQLLTTRTPSHPDVVQLETAIGEIEAEIRQLERQIGSGGEFTWDGGPPSAASGGVEMRVLDARDLAALNLQPPVGKEALAETDAKDASSSDGELAFHEALRELAAHEAALASLLEQTVAAERAWRSALQEEDASAAEMRRDWDRLVDAARAEKLAVNKPSPGEPRESQAASPRGPTSSWGLRGVTATALGLLAAIAAGWIWTGFREPDGAPAAELSSKRSEPVDSGEPLTQRSWRADSAQPLSPPLAQRVARGHVREPR